MHSNTYALWFKSYKSIPLSDCAFQKISLKECWYGALHSQHVNEGNLMWVLTNTFWNFDKYIINLDNYIFQIGTLRLSENFIEGMWNAALCILNLWIKAALVWVLTNTFCNFDKYMFNLDKYILNLQDLRFSENFIEGMWNVALCILNLLWMKAALTNTMILKSYFQLYFHHIFIIFLIIFQKICLLTLWIKEFSLRNLSYL